MSSIFNVLFLDIDGVLNSDLYFKTRPDEDNRPYPLSEFDPALVRRVNQILEYCDLLVLSSDWRFTEGINNILKNVGIDSIKVNHMWITPYLGHIFRDKTRGHEIDFVIKDLKRSYSKVNYVIIDDLDSFMKFQKRHFIKTSYRHGLTENDVNKAIEILMDTGLYV